MAATTSDAADPFAMEGVHWVTNASDEIPTKVGYEGPTAWKPTTVIAKFQERVASTPDRVVCQSKIGEEWVPTTWQEYNDQIMAAAKSLIALGLERFDGVGVLGFNCLPWFVANMSTIMAGGIVAGVYTTNGPEAVHYILDHCDATVVFAENSAQMSKVLAVRDRLPNVKAFVQWSGDVEGEGVLSWDDFMAAGAEVADEDLQARMDAQRPGHCCTLIYTSGTTGNPKAVMISHDNLTWTSRLTAELIFPGEEEEHIISFLPLSHIAAQMIDIHLPITRGVTVWFAQPDALKGTLGVTMKEVRPTMFLAVPRVWEKMMDKIKMAIAAKMKAAMEAGITPQAPPAGALAMMLGLDRCHYASTAAAPIAREVLDFYAGAGIPIYEIYGMSECTGPQTVNIPAEGMHLLGTVGPSIPATELILDDQDADGNGEICYRGRHIFMGYMKNREATANTIDARGYLHSGDIGALTDDGFLQITGRIKELIITAGGENIPPVVIEKHVKELCPLLSNFVVIGDRRKFLSALATIKCEIDPNTGRATDQLTPQAQGMIAALGSTATTYAEAINDDLVKAHVQEAIDTYNADRAISNAQTVKKFAFLDEDLSLAGGELTPTLKLKRRIVHQKNADLIESFYA